MCVFVEGFEADDFHICASPTFFEVLAECRTETIVDQGIVVKRSHVQCLCHVPLSKSGSAVFEGREEVDADVAGIV